MVVRDRSGGGWTASQDGVSRVEPPRRYPAETVGLAAGNRIVVVRLRRISRGGDGEMRSKHPNGSKAMGADGKKRGGGVVCSASRTPVSGGNGLFGGTRERRGFRGAEASCRRLSTRGKVRGRRNLPSQHATEGERQRAGGEWRFGYRGPAHPCPWGPLHIWDAPALAFGGACYPPGLRRPMMECILGDGTTWRIWHSELDRSRGRHLLDTFAFCSDRLLRGLAGFITSRAPRPSRRHASTAIPSS